MSVVTSYLHWTFIADWETIDPLAALVDNLPSNAEQLSKHQAGQFEWLLSLPPMRRGSDATKNDGCFDGADKRLLFGCNLMRRKPPSGNKLGSNKQERKADTCVYTLLATRVECDDSGSADKVATAEEISTIIMHANASMITAPLQPEQGGGGRRTSEVALSAKHDDVVEQLITLPPAKQTSRIEDSVEALDKLEEELEALNEVTHLERVLSPEMSKAGVAGQQSIDSLQRTGSMARKSGASTVRVRGSTDRSSSVRKSVSTGLSQDEDKANSASSTKGPQKSLVTRPASLRQPKPPAKSSKQPTMSTFELPGEAVARRLKEQREARLSRHITPEEAALAAQAYSPSKPHAKSMKQPTRPTFELPGEAISRRKREEREARLRAQEEEERKRREFKARPIRASIVPSANPRETIASRARQGKAQGEGESSSAGAGTATPTSAARKRRSMATTRTASSMTRGRSELAVTSTTDASRATSTSTGSIHGGTSVVSVSKRSSVSVEDHQQQKARGREIFARDNSIAAQRERGRKEKEAAAKAARQEAAERSRQLSREWAEKQKKRMSLGVAGAGSSS